MYAIRSYYATTNHLTGYLESFGIGVGVAKGACIGEDRGVDAGGDIFRDRMSRSL